MPPGERQPTREEMPSGRLLTPLDAAAEELDAVALTERLGLWERPSEPPARPRVMLNMISSADGRATLTGRSGPLSGPADREFFHALRSCSDAVLVGAGTVRAERYGRMLREEGVRELRVRRGLSPEPLACIVSGRLALPEDIPLLREEESRVVVLTASEASLPETGAQIDYVRSPGEQLDLASAFAELSERFALCTLICEGGPHLARELVAGDLLDEIFLTLSPMLAGGEPSSGQALRILAGMELEPPAHLELLGAARSGSYLFLRYALAR